VNSLLRDIDISKEMVQLELCRFTCVGWYIGVAGDENIAELPEPKIWI
jgi:hypothetical protein